MQRSYFISLAIFQAEIFQGVIDYGLFHALMASSDDSDQNYIPFAVFIAILGPLNAIFILISYNTSNEQTVNAFLWFFYGGLITLIVLWVLVDRLSEEDMEPLQWANSPGWKGFLIAQLLFVVVLFINIAASSFGLNLLPSGYGPLQGAQTNSVLFIPQFFSTTQAGNYSLLDNVLFEFTLTGPGEEMLKAGMLYGFYMLAGRTDRLSESAEIFAVGMSTGIWASMHVILVHFSLPEIGLAFASGIVMYIGWRVTGSLMTSILIHSEYDGFLALMSGLSFNLVL